MSFDWAVFWATIKEDAVWAIPLLVIYNGLVWIYRSRERRSERKWYDSDD